MQTLKKPIFFLLGILLSTSSTKCNENNDSHSLNPNNLCLIQVCSYTEPITRYIQFPFLLTNDSLPKSCGYPGFNLFCNKDDKLLINLPNSGVFSVKQIDYVNQRLWLNDPDYCLPRRFLALNNSSFLGKSPFSPVFEQDFWFYNCSNDFFKSYDHQMIKKITCLSGRNYSVFATSLENINIIEGNYNYSYLCDRIGPIKIPVRYKLLYDNEMYLSTEFKDDIMISWEKASECGECYRRNGICRFKNISSLEVGCFNLPRRGLSREAMFAIGLAFATPLILVSLCIIYFLIKAIRYRRRIPLSSIPMTSSVRPQPERAVIVHGLNRSVIDSYPKIVLGESKRLPKPEDKNCSICLGEYQTNEILRTIPICGHCFHAHCIDAWLLLNASCPVCRISPSLVPQHTVS